jgi:organic hydroperoxide reductase OsmC/OhrA
MASLDKVLYTARAHTTGGRDGASRTDDGRLDVKLSSPGGSGTGTNPEQLFAAGWASPCRRTWRWTPKWTWAPFPTPTASPCA